MILLDFHCTLLKDGTAQLAFRNALAKVLKGGEIVLDLGTGTGIHAFFACEAGAQRVYAVDSQEVVELAREIAIANGFADRITFIHADASQLTLPERVDVIVAYQGLSDLFTLLPPARDRLLKPGGVVIPSSVELFAVPLNSPRAYEEKIEPWSRRMYGLTFEPLRWSAVNSSHTWNIAADELLSEPMRVAEYDLLQVQEPNLIGLAETEIGCPGMMHGLGVFMRQVLTDDIAITTAPTTTLNPRVWSNIFLPVEHPVSVKPGDRILIRLRTGTGGWGKLWNWEVTVRDRSGREKVRCAHSTFAGWVLSRGQLRKQLPEYVPELGSRGQALRFILDCIDGNISVSRIEEALFEQHADLFKTHREAAAFIAEIVSRYADSHEDVCSTASAI